MLSPIKTAPLPPSFFVSVGVTECVGAKGIYHKLLLTHRHTHTHARAYTDTHTPQSPLWLSNDKVVTQWNKSQTAPGPGWSCSPGLAALPHTTSSSARGDGGAQSTAVPWSLHYWG